MSRGKPTRPTPAKTTTIQLRLRADEKAMIAQAAKLQHTTMSKFVVEHACEAAQQVLVGQVHFTLPPERWRAFCEALDAPSRVVPALKQLLTNDAK
jgi:uncharacterized protein (DUF1778 family)